MKPGILLILLLSVLSGKVLSQVISFNAGTDKQRIVIGEPVKLKLEAIIPVNQLIDWIELDTIPHFEILDASPIDSSTSFNGLKLTQTITITSWDSGSWNIPSIALLNARSKPVQMEVGYSPMDPEQPYHDIKDIKDVPLPEQPEWYWYILAIALLLILFLLFFPKSKEKGMVKKVQEDPYKKAMQRLSAIDPSAEDKKFFTDLINIFREYLLNKKDIQSYTKTTEDLVLQLKEVGLNKDDFTSVVQVLRMSDLVKFAKFNAAAGEKQDSVRIIKENIARIENRK